jgi:transcriptional regulator
MYNPAHFQVDDPTRLHALVRAHPLATLVVPGEQGLQVQHLPLRLEQRPDGDVLAGHVARANPVWRALASGEAVAVFHGPQGYVSPGWYASKAEHGRVVPTWNYAVVHAHGTLRWIDDAAWLRAFLTRFTDEHEAARAVPWHMDDAPAEFTDRLLGALVGVELRVTRWEGKFKLSQNRPAADVAGVIQGLEAQPAASAAALAAVMRGEGTT